MKKNLKKFLVATLAVLSISALTVLASGCSCKFFGGETSVESGSGGGETSVESGSNVGENETPAGVTLNKDGTLTWPEIAGATYKISVDGTNYVDAASNSVSVFDYVKSTSVTKVYVKATKDGKDTAVGDVAVEVIQLATPDKPEITVDADTKTKQFVWSEVENVKQYSISVNGGKWSKYINAYWTPGSTGTYTIKVKCLEYVKISNSKNQIFLASGESEVSDTLNFLEGPVLSLETTHVVSWAAAEEFDSYNIWIDGVKAKDNVTSPLNLVTGNDPVITKTGEYDVQIEGIKDGESIFSNLLEEMGTMNINEGEIYSFDNRKFNVTAAKEGYAVTDERYHGNSGYSLKITGNCQGQLNAVRYATEGINDVDFRTISKLSYWVYVEPIAGYTYDYVPSAILPNIKYDATNGHMMAKEAQVPIGEWTKLTFDVEIQHEQVLILSMYQEIASVWPDGTAFPVVFYIDDICYEEQADDIVDDYEAKLTFNTATAADSYGARTHLVQNLEAAGKTIAYTAKIAGNFDSSKITAEPCIAVMHSTKIGNGALAGWAATNISVDKVSSSTWSDIQLNITFNASGNAYLVFALWENDADTQTRDNVSVYLKDLQPIAQPSTPVVPEGTEYTGWFTGYFATGTAVKVLTGLEANKQYTISFSYQTEIDGRQDLGLESNKGPFFLGFKAESANSDNYTGDLWGTAYDVTTTGWKSIRLTVTTNATGDVYIGSTYAGTFMANLKYAGYSFYIKNVQVIAAPEGTEYTGSFTGYFGTGTAAKVLTGLDANTQYTISFDYQTEIDGKNVGIESGKGPHFLDFSAESTSTDNAIGDLWGTAYDVTTTGWKSITLTVTTTADGDVYIGSTYAGTFMANLEYGKYNFYIKNVRIVTE